MGAAVDPLAGSYLIEYLTDQIEQGATEYIFKIDEMGGALSAIEGGYMQNEIQEAAYQAQKAIEKKEQIVVGVNQFQSEEKLTLDKLKIDPAIETAAHERLAAFRSKRANAKVAELRSRLERAARTNENMMPLFIECVENNLTLGEICNTVRGVWGEYRAEGF